jgi:hypothetical protein
MGTAVVILLAATTLSTTVFANPKNESALQTIDRGPIKLCKGWVPKEVNLKTAGLSSDALKTGISCVASDFDKNGYLDFVLYGKQDTMIIDGEDIPVGIKLLILLYKGKEIVKTQLIRHGAKVFVFGPNAPGRDSYPEHDSSYPALIRPGEGDRGYVYFFNPKKGLFEEDQWVPPDGYEMGD